MKSVNTTPQKASRPQVHSRGRRWLKRAGKVLLVSTFASMLVVGWAYQQARAQISESFFGLGEQMMQFANARHQDAPRDLVINGQMIHFSSGTIEQPMEQVFDTLEERCDEVDGDLNETIRGLAEDHPDIDADVPPNTPTLRENDGSKGYVACLDMGPASVSIDELAQRISRFADTGDVAEIGDMRYVFAEEYEVEGATRTHFVAMWTQGEFNVLRMFPETGDVPGDDIEDLPRPSGTRRVLSGYERGVSTSLTVFQSPEATELELQTHYRTALRDNGWTVLQLADPPPEMADGPPTMVAEKGERMVTVVVAANARTGGATAAVFQSR